MERVIVDGYLLIRSHLWDMIERHKIGDIDCPECVWPKPERCVCGGVIHFWDYDESYDDATGEAHEWSSRICDTCGAQDGKTA